MAYAIESMGGWMDVVCKLRNVTPEMRAHYTGEFKKCYEIGTRGLRLPSTQYFPGYAERTNREQLATLSGWAVATGQHEVMQSVVVVEQTRYQVFKVPFSAHTMEMDAVAAQSLRIGIDAMRPYAFVPATDRPVLVGDGGPVGPEERRQIIDRLRLLTAGSVSRTDGEARTADLLEAAL
jgi:hypothetical protein